MDIRTYVHIESDGTASVFSEGSCNFAIEHNFKYGDMVIDLLDLSVSEIEELYSNILDFMVSFCTKGDSSAQHELYLRCNKLDTDFPCLSIHTHLLHNAIFMLLWRTKPEDESQFKIYPLLLETVGSREALKKKQYSFIMDTVGKRHESLEDDTFVLNKKNIKDYFDFIRDLLIEDINYIHDIVNRKADQIYSCPSIQHLDFNPMQRLTYYEKASTSRVNPLMLIKCGFIKKIVPNALENNMYRRYPISADDIINKLQQCPRPLLEVYCLLDTSDIFKLDFVQLILSGKSISKCAYCGRFFILEGKRVLKYCNKIALGENLPCDVIGPKRAFENKVSQNPVYLAYNKAYKRNNARMKNQRISSSEFKAWSEKARDMRVKCLNGEITLKEFNDWLENRS